MYVGQARSKLLPWTYYHLNDNAGTTEFGTGFTLVCKVTFGHLAWTSDPTSSGSEQLFLKLASPTRSTPSLRWHRFLSSIEISVPVTRDTMFYNGFQEVSSPRMNPSPKREQSSWLSLGRQRQAATNQIFQKHLIKWILMLWKDKSTVLILPAPEGTQSYRADLDPP